MNKEIRFLEEARGKSNSYMSRNILRHASSVIQRGLYSYSGVYQREKMFSYLHTISEERRSVDYSRFSGFGDGYSDGIWNAYPFNCLALGSVSQYMEVKGILNVIIDLAKHYDLPYYENYLAALFNNIIGGLTKGSIHCKYIELAKLDAENDLLKIDLNLKQQQVSDQWKPIIEKIQSEAQMMVMGSRDNPEAQEAMKQEYQVKIQDVNEQLNQQLQSVADLYQEQFFKPLELMEKQANLLVTKIGESINQMLHDRHNISELVGTLETFMTTGFAVMKLHYCEEKNEFYFRNVARPETCFFSTITRHKNKSDSPFCGEVRYMDKLLISEEYNLSEEEVNDLEDFPPVSVNYASFFLPFGADKKDYIILCDYYYKKDGKVFKSIMCGNRILKNEELKYLSGQLPLIYLDTSNPEQVTSKSIFHSIFSLQKAINDDITQLQALINQLHGSKLVMGDAPEPVKDRMRREGFLKSPVLFMETESGVNEIVQPFTLPASELPQTLLMAIQDKRQTLTYMIQGIIQNNQFTKNSQSLGVVSGIAIENADMNQENSYAYFLDEIKKELTLSFQKIVIPNLYHTFVNGLADKGIEKYFIDMLRKGGRSVYDRVVKNVRLEIEWVVDATMTRNRTNLLLKEIAAMDIDKATRDTLINEIILNSDLAGGGNLIINKIQEAKEELAKQPPQPDPALIIEQNKLELQKQALGLEAEKAQSDSHYRYEELKLKYEELLEKTKKDIRDTTVKTFDIAATHKNNIVDGDREAMFKMVERIANDANDTAKNEVKTPT